MGKKSSTQDFINKSLKIHSNRYNYDKVVYTNSITKIIITCKEHGDFQTIPNSHLHSKSGCPKCGTIESHDKQRLNIDVFIERSREKHGYKYSYNFLKIKSLNSKVDIFCNIHGKFSIKAQSHLNGVGCRICYLDSIKGSIDDLKEKSIKKYGDIYDYSRFKYLDNKTKSIVMCLKGHESKISANRILSTNFKCQSCRNEDYFNKWNFKLNEIKGFNYSFIKGEKINITCLKCNKEFVRKSSEHFRLKNCIYCDPKRYTKDIFIRKSKEIHSDTYNYSLVEYISSEDKIKLICKKGHIIHQKVNNHLRGTGCPKCNRFDKKEISVLDFIKLNYNGYIDISNRKILKGKELDIYLPDLNLAFEFNGLYWHSESFKEKDYHLNKTKECLNKGIQLIHIWEDDWDNKQDIVKSIILNKLGKNTKKIYARKCEIKEIYDNKIIRDFLEENHIQGFVGSKVKLGLYYNNELVSLMTFGNLRRNLGQKSKEGSYELLRFCNKLNTSVIGGASKLFKYFIKNYNFKEIISYSDNSRSNGNLYKVLGFQLLKNTISNYYWVVESVRKNRFNFRKDKLIKKGYDPNKTEIEIMNELGYYRIFDCGSIKWIYSI